MKTLFNKALTDNLKELPLGFEGVIFAETIEEGDALKEMDLNRGDLLPEEPERAVVFEARREYDYLSIRVPDFLETIEDAPLLKAYITREKLLIVSDKYMLERLEEGVMNNKYLAKNAFTVLVLMFSYILSKDGKAIEKTESEIEELEQVATGKKPDDQTVIIMALRKRLLALKHYYEGIFDLLEDMEENQNQLFSEEQLRNIRIYKNRAERLVNKVASLKDYLSQVREAYQNQMDLSLNETMQFFTVITAVFLPLTLIAGWYGMNLRMPELASKITYPTVIIISIVFVVASLIFCRKKGWF